MSEPANALRAAWPLVGRGGAAAPGVPVGDIGPIALFHDEEHGAVGLTLTALTVTGLDSFDAGSLGVDPEGGFRATAGFGRLRLRGRYAVTAETGDGAASALLGRLLAADDDDGRLALARDYRDQLTQSPDGSDLVASYYDHNDAMYDICSGVNVFTANFPTKETTYGGQTVTSRTLADSTTLAARAPDDPAHTVGDDVYRMHAGTMQFLFAAACEKAYHKTNDPRYLAAGAASVDFNAVVSQDGPQGAVTVGQVMADVADGAPARARAVLAAHSNGSASRPAARELGYQLAEEVSEPMRLAAAAAAEVIAEWERAGTPTLMPWEVPVGLGPVLAEGGVEATLALRPVTLAGTVRDGAVALTATDAMPPAVDPALDGDGDLLARVRAALDRAEFVHDLLGVRIRDALTGDDVRTYLQGLIAAALAAAGDGGMT